MTPRFELKGVSRNYRSFTALQNIDLTIREKQVTALAGDSGSGKSTLTRLLMRLEQPNSGEIFYKGEPIETVPIQDFRKKNQIVFQNPLLSVNPCFRISKILAEPLSIAKVDNLLINKKIEGLLEIMELPKGFLRRYPSELSGGELQRVVLARALTLDPEYLVLDEPFSAIDYELAARLEEYLKNLIQTFGIGLLLISHRVEHVQALADVVFHLSDGRIER